MRRDNESNNNSYQQELEQLFTQHFPSLLAYGFHLSGDRALTKDMIQNLFLELWEKQPPIDSVQQWNAYLKKSLLRKIIKELKRRNRTSHNLDADLTVLSQPSYEELLIAFQTETDRKARVQVALQDLPLVEKEMLEARFKNGKSYEEIAAQSGKSKQTVYNQIYSAIKKLRKALLCSFF